MSAEVQFLRERMLTTLAVEREVFYRGLVSSALARRGITLPPQIETYVAREAQRRNVPIAAERAVPAIFDLYQEKVKNGPLPLWVEVWVDKVSDRSRQDGEAIDKDLFTAAIKGKMVEYLRDFGLPYAKPDFQKRLVDGVYDEFFALAFENARRKASAEEDPIDVARTKGSVAEWDFTVDLFEQAEAQGILKDNILAAGAIDYVYWLGDFLGVFKIADAIILRWASGQVDVASGDSASKLYRYFKLRDERSTEEERAMLYKRVLARGDAPMLSRMVVNEAFPALWHKLMSETAEFIRKSEETKGGTEQVSATPILQAVRDLQYNLTEHATGLAHMQAREMYAHLNEALEILRDPEILDHFGGGRRKNFWTVIERISKDEFGVAPNVSAIRTLAVEGNRVFRWVAEYEGSIARGVGPSAISNVDINLLRQLLEPGEAWIIAQAELEGTLPMGGHEETEEVEVEEPAAGGDEFADWNA